MRTLAGIEQLIHEIRLTDWDELFERSRTGPRRNPALCWTTAPRCLNATLEIHHLIADGFLNHQIHMGPHAQPTLFGYKHAL